MSVTLDDILATERYLHESMGVIEEHDDHTVWRCDRYPFWYRGNGIRLHDPTTRTLEGWLSVFRAHFPADTFRHVNMFMEDRAEESALANQARESGYTVLEMRCMYATDADRCVDLDDHYEISRMSTDEDWRNRREFNLANARTESWFTGDDAFHRYFDLLAELSGRVGIDWYRLSSAGSREIISSLGLFRHGSICRLQDIATRSDARRQGHASALVSFAIRQALDTEGVQAIALKADRKYFAIDLYRKLGFQEAGGEIFIKRYPS